ncbi:energy-coupling factor transporter ATPase [Oenococcus sicerae]|uniref:Energy-coupling factor transporter ATPase n=1 Tax=Oenococcus sicerae TaxID=2203724 RepID=A0AAJ1VNF5_9LACO|nr:energy-coupling factor transporter ATPase [Oenococcus sicerae]MDN6899814.1 energy-coupling factor transporter ATPase [Oenococcus sicerae]QAS70500.1 energy-coupling factor transporter ATPase [Oenococcus sicerae]
MTILQVKNLNYHYSQMTKASISKLNFSLNSGEWLTILGKNGSGKSTLVHLLDGLLLADSGQIIIDGQILSKENIWSIRKKIGIVFQNPDNQFVGETVLDDVAFGMENNAVTRKLMFQRANDALQKVNMAAFADRQPARLSGGQKQRVAIAGVLVLNPKILILDEATSMLDPIGRQEVWQTIKKLRENHQLTVISISHDLTEMALSDRVIVLNDGKITFDGKAKALFLKDKLLNDNGLKLPFLSQLVKDLRQNKIMPSGNFKNGKELAALIWKSFSSM